MSGVQVRTVSPDETGMRLDRWFRTHFPQVRHGELEKYLRKGQVRVAGGRVKSNRRLEAGEEIRIPPLSEGKTVSITKTSYNREDAAALKDIIIYEDEALLALNKPFGLAVQGGVNTKRHIDAMLSSFQKSGEKPRLVHRLDKDTGGLLLVAKTRRSAQALADAFKHHTVDKTYWALTVGVPRPREGTINLPIAKRMVRLDMGDQERVVPADGDDAKTAITDYQVIEDAGRVAFVAMRPVTGRTHQLRVHAAAINTPIVGDGKYGGALAQIEGVSDRLHLFCREMTFTHPLTSKRMTLRAPLTGHMAQTWQFFSFDTAATCNWPEMR